MGMLSGESKEGKGCPTMIPASALIRVGKHFQKNAKPYGKYEPCSWKRGEKIQDMLDSCLRHLYQYLDGQRDEDHLVSATCNLLIALWTEENRPDLALDTTEPPLDYCDKWQIIYGKEKQT